MNITITASGFYDTSHEYKVALMKQGDRLEPLKIQPEPVRGKTGIWCHGEPYNVFVETENQG